VIVLIQLVVLIVTWQLTKRIERSTVRLSLRFGIFGYILAPSLVVSDGVFPAMAFWLFSICVTATDECGPMNWQLGIYPSLALMFLLGIIGYVLGWKKEKIGQNGT
jgi:hypothetical protein